MAKVTPGKRFEHDISQSLQRLPGFALRLLDGGEVTKNNMPGDFAYWSNDGSSFIIECKATKQRSFPFKNLKPHQLESLLRFESLSPATGSIIALNFYADDLAKLNRCILIPALKFAAHMSRSSRKSLPMKDALKIGIECPRIVGGVWNLKDAFERIIHVQRY